MDAILPFLVAAVTTMATTYGHGELSCRNDLGYVTRCVRGARTASGEVFDPARPTAAIWLPRHVRLKPQWVNLSLLNNPMRCVRIWINDKKGSKGFDLSPGAIRELGEVPSRNWKGRVRLCETRALALSQ
jgi:hypothetical protein